MANPRPRAANFLGNSVTILQGDGSGGFSTGSLHATGNNPGFLTLADLNNDFLLDPVVPDQADGTQYPPFLGCRGGSVF